MVRLPHFVILALLTAPLLLAATADAAPTALLEATPRGPDVDEIVSFDASRSEPGPGASELMYRFLAGDGTETDWQSAGVWQHAYGSKGTYTATVIVRNEYNDTAEDTIRVEVGRTGDTLIFGLSAMALVLVFVVLALVIGIAVLLVRRRKKASEPYYDPYIGESWTGDLETPPDAEGETGEGPYGYDAEGYDARGRVAPAGDTWSRGDDFIEGPEDAERPTGAGPAAAVPRARPRPAAPPRAAPPPPRAGASSPRPAVEPGRSPYERPAPEPAPVERPEAGMAPSGPSRAPARKTLLVDCPNCGNEMTITYVAPPVYLTCERCGMKGEVPEEMLG